MVKKKLKNTIENKIKEKITKNTKKKIQQKTRSFTNSIQIIKQTVIGLCDLSTFFDLLTFFLYVSKVFQLYQSTFRLVFPISCVSQSFQVFTASFTITYVHKPFLYLSCLLSFKARQKNHRHHTFILYVSIFFLLVNGPKLVN